MDIVMFVLVVLLIPSIMMGFGYRWTNKPPGKINWIYGYRSKRSMKNQDTWDFAHRYVGRVWLKWGMGAGFASLILWMLFPYGEPMISIIMYGQLFCLLFPVILTESALKKTFTKDGQRKS